MNNVLKLVKPPMDYTEAARIIDDLKAKLLSGEIKAFVAVGIEPDHQSMMWSVCTEHTSRLEIMGAIAHLQNSYHNDP